jgi:UDP-glucose 4-epimerase
MGSNINPINANNPVDSTNSIKSKNILITGGCGFIGVNLVDYLVKKGIGKLRILDNLSVGRTEYLESMLQCHGHITKNSVQDKKIVYIVHPHETNEINQRNQIGQTDQTADTEIALMIGDTRDKETSLIATENIDCVVHLAAHAGVIPSIENPFYDFQVNALGTLNMLYASVQNKIERFVLASSNAPLGNQTTPLNENMAPRPLSPYGASKLACEAYCSAFYRSYGLKTICLRFSNAYGPYSLHKNSVIAKFIKDGIIKKELTIYGNGAQTRDFVHVMDLCSAIGLCLSFNNNGSEQDRAYEMKLFESRKFTSGNLIWGEIFNIGTGVETQILDLANLIKRFFYYEVKFSFLPEREGEIGRNFSDIEKAQKNLKFSPQIFLKDGVESLHKWYMSKGIEEIKEAEVLSGSE